MKNNSIFNHIKNILILPGMVVLAIPYLLRKYVPELHVFQDLGNMKYASIVFLALGAILFITTIYLFWRIGKGTLAPWNGTERLVIAGPYKYVRNPMILGVLCLIIGQSAWYSSINLWLFAMIFFFINHLYFILKEEPDLEERFGNDYKDYLRKVPRWIPNFNSYY